MKKKEDFDETFIKDFDQLLNEEETQRANKVDDLLKELAKQQ